MVVLHGTSDGEGLAWQQQQLASHVQLDLLGAPQLYEGVVLCLSGWMGRRDLGESTDCVVVVVVVKFSSLWSAVRLSLCKLSMV